MTAELGRDLLEPRVSRALAAADYDNDGDLDVLITNNGQAPQLLRNDGGNRKHWIEVRLIGTRSNRDGIGAAIRIAAGGRTQFDQAKGGMSYQSAHDPRVHFGLGDSEKVDLLEVRWPSGAIDTLTNLAANCVVTVKEGAGEVPFALPTAAEQVIQTAIVSCAMAVDAALFLSNSSIGFLASRARLCFTGRLTLPNASDRIRDNHRDHPAYCAASEKGIECYAFLPAPSILYIRSLRRFNRSSPVTT